MKKIMMAIAGIGLFASCSNPGMKEKDAILSAQQKTLDSIKMEMVKQRTIDSMSDMLMLAAIDRKAQEKPVVVTKVVRSAPKRVERSNTESYAGYSNTPAQPVTQTQPAAYPETPAQPQKKGWSAKAKGAVIGAGAGAVAGAVIHKRQPAVGAVVGGILGAGAGTGIGAVIDKKNGR